MAGVYELSPRAQQALRHLAGSIGVVALDPAEGTELVAAGFARPIGAGYAITVRGVAASTSEAADETPDEDAGASNERTDPLF